MIGKNIKRFALLSVMAVGALGLSGCKVRGGGTLPGVEGGKATFGFTLQTGSKTPNYGQLQYTDKRAGINIHGVSTYSPTSGVFVGTYKSQISGATGTFIVAAHDHGKFGLTPEDAFAIALFEGVSIDELLSNMESDNDEDEDNINPSYANIGLISGGNIKRLDGGTLWIDN